MADSIYTIETIKAFRALPENWIDPQTTFISIDNNIMVANPKFSCLLWDKKEQKWTKFNS